MASVREYLEKMESEQLERFLDQEVNGWERFPLSVIYVICAILAERRPGDSPKELFLRFCEAYADKKEDL